MDLHAGLGCGGAGSGQPPAGRSAIRIVVVALGDQGKERISVEEIATTAGMIPWDVLTSISRRVPRFYRQG